MGSVQIPLTRGKFAIVDEADASRVSEYTWHAVDRGRTHYAATSKLRRSGGGVVYLHRFLLGAAKGIHVDHVNGDGLDCRRENLRLCTNAENRRNTAKTRGVSRFKGVAIASGNTKRKWSAYINFQNHKISLGAYETEEEAARAYNAAALKYHGRFARLNFIEGLSYEESVSAPARNSRPGRRPASTRAAA